MSVAEKWLRAQKEQEENTRRKIEMAKQERGLQRSAGAGVSLRGRWEQQVQHEKEKQEQKRENLVRGRSDEAQRLQSERAEAERKEKERREQEEKLRLEREARDREERVKKEKREREEKEKHEREEKEKREREEKEKREQEEKVKREREEKEKRESEEKEKCEQEEKEKREREEKEKREREEKEKREQEEKEKREREEREKQEQDDKEKREREEELKKSESKEREEPEDKDEKEKNDKREQELGQVKSSSTHLETRKLSDPPLDDVKIIVMDAGSTTIRIGFAGSEHPWDFPSVISRHQYIWREPQKRSMTQDFFIGPGAMAHSNILKLRYPIQRGVIKRFDYMEKLWHYAFRNELRADPAEHPLLLTECPTTPKSVRERVIETMFETYSVPSLAIANSNVLSMYSQGCLTGISVDSGGDTTRIVPVYEGMSIPRLLRSVDIGGRLITEYLQRLMMEEGYPDAGTRSYLPIIDDIKERFGYVALDYDEETLKHRGPDDDFDYRLPDGNLMSVRNSAFKAPELFFKPHLMGDQFDSLDQHLLGCITGLDADFRKEFSGNIVLSGGNTMFKGFRERVEKEMLRFFDNAKVVAAPGGTEAVWMGGSILANHATFPHMVVTREEYKEVGLRTVHRKCIQ